MSTFYEITPCYFGWGYGYGFFSNYRMCLEMLIYFYENKEKFHNMIPYISWKNTTWVENFNPFENSLHRSNINPFNWWFEQININQQDEIIYGNKEPTPGSIIDHSKDYFDDNVMLEKQQNIDKLYIKPKKFILDKINTIYEKEFANEVVLGVMARGSEYNKHHPQYGVFGIDTYINKIKDVLNKNKKITKIFIVSEETEYVEKIHKEFQNSFYIPDVFRRTDESDDYINKVHCWINVSKKRENHTQLLGEECIIQTKLLGKCDYLCGRHCGLIAGAVLWNENIKNVIIF